MVEYKIDVKVDTTNTRKGLKGAVDELTKAEKSAGGLEKALKQALGVFISFKAVKGFFSLAEEADNISEKLRLVTKSEEDLIEVTEQLRQISNEGGASLATSAEAYQALSLASKELGKTDAQLLTFLRNLEVTIRASGKSANEAGGAIKQLAFALSTGEVSGRALKTILNEIPTVADALATQLGVTRSGLKELADQGGITGEDLFKALEQVSPKIEDLAKQAGGLDTAFGELRNETLGFVKDLDQGIGVIFGTESALKGLAETVRDVRVAYDEATHAVEWHQDRLNKIREEGLRGSALGTSVIRIQRELAELQARPVQSEGVKNYIALLKKELEKLGDQALEIRDAERAAVQGGRPTLPGGGPAPIRAVPVVPKDSGKVEQALKETEALKQQAAATALLTAEDVRRDYFTKKINAKLEEQLAATQAMVGGDRDLALAQQLINAEQDKDVAKRVKVTKAMQDEFVAKARLINATRDEAEAYQTVFGAQEEYLRRSAALLRLAEKHPEAHKAIEESLDNLQLAYLEKSKSMGDGFERAFIKMRQEANDFASVAESAVNVFADDATTALQDLVTEGKGSFKDFADSVLKDLEKILIRFLVVQAITGIAGAAGVPGAAGPALGGAYADGGTTQPGRSYLVGENGPERFTPGQTGSVAPIAPAAATAPQVKIVNVIDPNEIAAVLASGEVDDVIVNIIARRKEAVRQVVR